jgi:MoxR-like ATPase
MGLTELLNKYANIRTGQDLIDAGVIPKTSSEMLTLMAYERMKALQRAISANLDEALVGKWIPAVEKKDDNYVLIDGITAEDKMGHRVRLTQKYNGQNWDKEGNRTDNEIPEGSMGSLKAIEKIGKSKEYAATIAFDTAITGRKVYKFKLQDLATSLEASSLGQFMPKDREQLVFEQSMYEFFPKTRLDTMRTARAIIGMILPDKDLILYGPPGAGKSTEARDITGLMEKHQGIRFEVEGCRFGCNPFSLFDEEFSKLNPPCPDCMEKRNANKKVSYRETGIYVRPKPKDVPVSIVKFGQGHGVTYVECTEETRRRHLIGQKLPKLDGTTDAERENQRSIEGLSTGAVTESNNGICHMEEIDKCRPQTHASLLEVMSNHRVQPDDVNAQIPCRNVILGTANDPTTLPEPIKDRAFLFAVRYHEEVEAGQRMLKTAYHGIKSTHNNVEIGDLHTVEPNILRNIVMPVTLENAVVSFYYKFRKDFNGEGRSDILGSNRSLIDALDSARGLLMQDGVYFKKTPEIANGDYAMRGIQFALCSRVATNSKAEDTKIKEGLRDWVNQNYPAIRQEEENTWCCNFFNKHLSVLASQVPEIKDKFFTEMDAYNKDVRHCLETYAAVKDAHDNPDNFDLQRALIEYPFMEYLFIDQPGMATIRGRNDKPDEALVQLMNYFVNAYQNSACKLNPTA